MGRIGHKRVKCVKFVHPESCKACEMCLFSLPRWRLANDFASNYQFPNYPTLDDSHHQDSSIFSRESQHKPSFVTGILGGGVYRNYKF